ncbi:rSAM-modified peptide [Flavobacterium sp. N1736]|uniref:rSAM-modified peptide n=1 Tax=Flavobacterium sp. N1736 TaxID=2986823 RepID=UPI0022240143|nr:rSAM-modified peptide [Flavobacterium sp. N1736]
MANKKLKFEDFELEKISNGQKKAIKGGDGEVTTIDPNQVGDNGEVTTVDPNQVKDIRGNT